MKTIILIPFALFTLLCSSQEQDNTFQFYSISFSPISVYSYSGVNAVSLYFDLGFNYNKNIFKASILSGTEFKVFRRGDEFTEFSALYGRELFRKKSFRIDGFAGLGYFRYTFPDRSINRTQDYLKKNTLSVPLQTRFRFQTGKSFSLGLQLHYSINSAQSGINTSLLLQWLL